LGTLFTQYNFALKNTSPPNQPRASDPGALPLTAMNNYQTKEYLHTILNAIHSRGTSGPVAGHIIEATTQIRAALLITEIALLDEEYERHEYTKQQMAVMFDINTQEYRVGNYFMFKAYLEQGNPRNLAGVFETRTQAEKFVVDLATGAEELDEYLTQLEKTHP
jgi:hypothetical protein